MTWRLPSLPPMRQRTDGLPTSTKALHNGQQLFGAIDISTLRLLPKSPASFPLRVRPLFVHLAFVNNIILLIDSTELSCHEHVRVYTNDD